MAPRKKNTKPKTALKDNATIEDESPKFTCFGKLPIELRLKIWGFAAPDPYVVVKARSLKSHQRFAYTRPVPAVLHACKESRKEFLVPETTDASLSMTQRENHPLYILSFRSRLRSTQSRQGLRSGPGIFFSAADTFWGTRYLEDPREQSGPRNWNWAAEYSGIASLDIAKNLRHLVLIFDYITRWDPTYFPQSFPQLETLTWLLEYSWQWVHTYPLPGHIYPHLPPSNTYVRITGPSRRVNLGVTDQLPPEIDGELNTTSMSAASLEMFNEFRSRVTNEMEKGKEDYPDWKAPALKFRLLQQYYRNLGLCSVFEG